MRTKRCAWAWEHSKLRAEGLEKEGTSEGVLSCTALHRFETIVITGSVVMMTTATAPDRTTSATPHLKLTSKVVADACSKQLQNDLARLAQRVPLL